MTRDLSYLQVEVAKFSIISRQSSDSLKKEAAEFLMSALSETRIWANAQRDGRPAAYRWRPLFNAAKFG